MPTPLNSGRKGKVWLDVTEIGTGKVVHTVEADALYEDRVTAGMLINMSENYFVDARHEFPEKGEKDKDGKTVK